MRFAIALITCSVAIAIVGCRGGKIPRGEAHAEMRRMEDRIYDLQWKLEQEQSQLDSCRRENDTLKKQLQDGFPFDIPKGIDDSENSLPDKKKTGGDNPFRVVPGVEVPSKELESESGTNQISPDDSLSNDNSDQDKANDEPVEKGGASRVLQIEINRRLTGGSDFDGLPGDEAILVVFSVHDQSKRSLFRAAPVRLEIVDPSRSEQKRQIATWDFTADEVSQHFREGPFGKGFHFELPWPNQPPTQTDLRLVVHYETPRGQSLRAQHNFTIALPPSATRWSQSKRPRKNFAPARVSNVGVSDPLPPDDAVDSEQPQAGHPAARASDGRSESEVPAWSPSRD